MSMKNVGIVYRKELREALRDRRTLISSLLVPLLLFPILTAGLGAAISALVGKAKEEIPKVMILGGSDSPQILEKLHKAAKITIAQVLKDPDQRDMDAIKQIGIACMDSEDFREGRRAFMEKRKPKFSGR